MTNAEALVEALTCEMGLVYENPITSWIECPGVYLKEDPCKDMSYGEIKNSDICHCCKLDWLNAEFKEF